MHTREQQVRRGCTGTDVRREIELEKAQSSDEASAAGFLEEQSRIEKESDGMATNEQKAKKKS